MEQTNEDEEPYEDRIERLSIELSELFKKSKTLEEKIVKTLEEIGVQLELSF